MCTYRESGFHLPVVCLDCGGNVERVNGSGHLGSETVAILHCLSCSHEFSMSIQLRRLNCDSDIAERRAQYKRDQRARAKANA